MNSTVLQGEWWPFVFPGARARADRARTRAPARGHRRGEQPAAARREDATVVRLAHDVRAARRPRRSPTWRRRDRVGDRCARAASGAPAPSETLVEVRGLEVDYGIERPVHAVDGVDLDDRRRRDRRARRASRAAARAPSRTRLCRSSARPATSSAAAFSSAARTSRGKSQRGAAQLPLAQRLDGVPERDERAQPGACASATQFVDMMQAHERISKRDALARAGELLELVGIDRRRVALVSARALGRHAPARDHRDGARARAGARDPRRADDGARRRRAARDPPADRGRSSASAASRCSSSRTTSRCCSRSPTGSRSCTRARSSRRRARPVLHDDRRCIRTRRACCESFPPLTGPRAAAHRDSRLAAGSRATRRSAAASIRAARTACPATARSTRGRRRSGRVLREVAPGHFVACHRVEVGG